MTHSREPWEVQDGFIVGFEDDSRYEIARVLPISYGTASDADVERGRGETKANGILLAAAPELLATWRDYIDIFNVEHEIEDCPMDDTCECPLVARINAAINKAEGR